MPPPPKRTRSDKSVGTDFRYAVEFSKIKHAPSKAARPSRGQPDQRYTELLRVSTRLVRPPQCRWSVSSNRSVTGVDHLDLCRSTGSVQVLQALGPLPVRLSRRQGQSYDRDPVKSNMQVTGSPDNVCAVGGHDRHPASRLLRLTLSGDAAHRQWILRSSRRHTDDIALAAA